MARKEIIRKLVDHGHSAAKALEIAIDYERGSEHARRWLETLKIA